MKMSKALKSAALILSCLLSGGAQATSTPVSTTITMTVNITYPSCIVSVPPSLDLGTYDASDFDQKGHMTPGKKFDIKISDCDTAGTKGVIIYGGTSDKDDATTFSNAQGEGDATGVGILINNSADGTQNVLKPNVPSDSVTFPNPGESSTFTRYARLKQSKDAVTGGNVSTSVTLSLQYD